MCFSPEVSFVASAGLSGVGIASAAVTTHRGKILVAIPFLFALQQAAEGAQWLALQAGSVNMGAAYLFVLFAFLVWPAYVPIAVYVLDLERRWLLRFLIVLGVIVSLGFFAALLVNSLSASAVNKSIQYSLEVPWGAVGVALYVIATAGSLLCSSKAVIRLFGAFIFVSFLVAQYLYSVTFVSVWCFFAGILSALVFVYIWKYENKRSQVNQLSQ